MRIQGPLTLPHKSETSICTHQTSSLHSLSWAPPTQKAGWPSWQQWAIPVYWALGLIRRAVFTLFVISKHWKELQKWILKTLSSSNNDKGLRKACQLNTLYTTESFPATILDDHAASAWRGKEYNLVKITYICRKMQYHLPAWRLLLVYCSQTTITDFLKPAKIIFLNERWMVLLWVIHYLS